MTSSGGDLFHNTAPFLFLKARTLYAVIGAWLWNIWLTFGIAKDCMPQPRYAPRYVGDGFGRVGEETILEKCGADGGGGGGKKSNRSEIVELRRKGGGNYV